MAVGLSFILTTTGLVYYWMQPRSLLISGLPKGGEVILSTPHSAITIDGDANFSATALLEGWPGDGSPENPFKIDRLEIDLGGVVGHGINISNTQVSFTISKCNLTGAYWAHGPCICFDGAAIYLKNVTNGELVNNTCSSNGYGIYLWNSYSNTVVNNTCNNNINDGIVIFESDSNTVESNTCYNNVACIIICYSYICKRR